MFYWHVFTSLMYSCIAYGIIKVTHSFPSEESRIFIGRINKKWNKTTLLPIDNLLLIFDSFLLPHFNKIII